jgi:dTDP-4-dehydrorhamnose 3,5-epimerase
MIFEQTAIQGVYLIKLEKKFDERGFFARTFDVKKFADKGLDFTIVQSSVSFNKKKGTVRGMHFQTSPHEEVKLLQCLQGAIYDVILDLRKDSPTYLKHVSVELSQENRHLVFIPKGVAHGFQTLQDNSLVMYHISPSYELGSSSGVRWNDPAFGIELPLPVSVISQKDLNYPNFS